MYWLRLGSWRPSIILNIGRINEGDLILVYTIFGMRAVQLFKFLFNLLEKKKKIHQKLLTSLLLFSSATWAGFDANTAPALFLIFLLPIFGVCLVSYSRLKISWSSWSYLLLVYSHRSKISEWCVERFWAPSNPLCNCCLDTPYRFQRARPHLL